jgi:hypothetical protein
VPRGDLVAPLGDGASEASDLWRTGLVLEIYAELGDELDSQLGVVDRLERPDRFHCVPGVADLAFRIARIEQSDQLQVRFAVEALVRERHQFATPVERIGLATAMATRLVLHPAADLVEHEIRELDDMERTSDLDSVREHREAL